MRVSSFWRSRPRASSLDLRKGPARGGGVLFSGAFSTMAGSRETSGLGGRGVPS
jgi:hypothetical protein